MLGVSTRGLEILAALVWHIGAAILMLKAGTLFWQADALKPHQIWPWLAIGGGLCAGGLKAKLIFNKSCRKNLTRIGALKHPKPWQFFRPGFFLFLVFMVTVGAWLSQLAHNHYPLLIGVAALDLSIATALIASGRIFWKR